MVTVLFDTATAALVTSMVCTTLSSDDSLIRMLPVPFCTFSEKVSTMFADTATFVASSVGFDDDNVGGVLSAVTVKSEALSEPLDVLPLTADQLAVLLIRSR